MGRIAVVILWMLVVAALLVRKSQQTAEYSSCSLGKGKPKLYNCNSKYDSRGTRSVRISDIDSPARYVIKLKQNESAKTVDEICEQAEAYRYRTYSGFCIHKYKKVWIGMLMMINGGNLSRMLNREGGSIDHVEVDGTLRICSGVVQGNPPNWGIDRIDHLPGQPLLNGLYTTASTGDGVHVYMLDTGIRCSHKEFRYQDGRLNKTSGLPLSRCLNGFDAVKDGFGTNDCNGHGTHCAGMAFKYKSGEEYIQKALFLYLLQGSSDAGIVGGLTTGVAKEVILHPIRAMNCDGTGSYGAILASLDWISHNLIRPAVISMSLATQASISIDQAVGNLINTTGIIGVAAAGNFLQATCKYSPARASSVIAVGSSNSVNQMSWFSNYGSCTTLFAPGELVYSTYHLTDSSYAVLSGTSMACPHVAGTAALYLSQNVDARPNEVRQVILDATEPNGVANLKPGTTTKLLNTNIKQPFFRIHPRSFYDAPENTTQQIVVSLLTKPSKPVTLTPQVDRNIGYFVPAQLFFGSSATWSLPQTMSLVVARNPDFLDHSSTIRWVFESQDTQYVASPEGLVTAHDTDICRKCGQTADNPKIIPSLPFYYLEDTSNYQSYFNEKSNPDCHSSGPDVVFQYTATANMVVNISLCGINTQFDTTLTLYEKITNNNKTYNLTFIDCNDDSCGLQSFLINMALQKGHTYIIVVDGYFGAYGAVDFYMYPSGAPSSPVKQQLPTTISVITSIITSSNEVESAICTRWQGEMCETKPTSLPIQAGFFWSPVAWGLCDKNCGGGSQNCAVCVTGTPVIQFQRIQSSSADLCSPSSQSSKDTDENLSNIKIQSTRITSRFCNHALLTQCCWQQAVMKCFTGNYTEVAESNCAAVSKPLQTQVCNVVACKTYSLIEGPWGECNQTCGTGTQKRQVTCMDSLGNTANPAKCGGITNFLKERLCNTHACNNTHWKVGLWNYCNLPCDRGKKFRNPICWSNGTVVGDNNCRAFQSPLTKMECNTHPCQTFAWLVGRWDECPAGCNATKGRVVQCVDGLGHNVGDILCNATNKPAATITCQQPGATGTCNNCQLHNCSNNGICQKSSTVKFGLLGTKQPSIQSTECNCFKGWEGLYCERPKICKGRPIGYVKNGTLGCCPYSKVDNRQHCCGTAGAIIDIDGACCDGTLDACGMCNGPHKSIDSQNQCCPTLRDEKGICCASGTLDECYICDGDGTTCATNITIITVLDDSVKAAKNSSANWKAFMILFMTKVATELRVATEALLLTGVQTTNSETGSCHDISDIKQGCLTSVTKQFLGVFNFTVLPIPMKDLTEMKIEVADISSQLSPPDDPTKEFIPGVKMHSVSHAKRAGICGNGMCERGERCDQFGKSETSSGPCCLKDCPYVPKSCPVPVDGPRANLPCSNNGFCLDASGHCDCFPGYQGKTCWQCQNGWTEMQDGTCMKILDPVRVQALNFSSINITIPPGPWNDNITVTKGTAAAGILGTMVAMSTFIGIICCIKHCCCSKTKRPDTPTGLATVSSNVAMDDQNRQAQEARRKSLAVERHEAVEDRRKSRMYSGGADRKSLLMEPVVVKSSPSAALAPAPIQSEDGNVINKLRKSIVGDSAVVIGGWRKSLAGDQEYAKLDPSTLKAGDSRYQNTPTSVSRYEDQQFQNVPLSTQRYEGQQYQNAQQSQTAQSYTPRYDGQQYQNSPQQGQNTPIYTPQYEGQRYQNAPPPRYTTQQFQNDPPQARYEAQQFQNSQPYPQIFQPTQHFQIIPIPNPLADEMGPAPPTGLYHNNLSPITASSMGAGVSSRYATTTSPAPANSMGVSGASSAAHSSHPPPTNLKSKGAVPSPAVQSPSAPQNDDSLI